MHGPTEDGIAYGGVPVSIAFPDLSRARPRTVVLDGESLDAAPSVLAVSIDGGAPVLLALDARRPARIEAPARHRSGLRIDVVAQRGAPPARIRSVRAPGAWPSPLALVLVAALAALVVAGVTHAEALGPRAALAVAAMAAAGMAVFFSVATRRALHGLAARGGARFPACSSSPPSRSRHRRECGRRSCPRP